MTYLELQGLGVAILSRSQLNFGNLQRVKGELRKAVSVEELEAVIINGWS